MKPVVTLHTPQSLDVDSVSAHLPWLHIQRCQALTVRNNLNDHTNVWDILIPKGILNCFVGSKVKLILHDQADLAVFEFHLESSGTNRAT